MKLLAYDKLDAIVQRTDPSSHSRHARLVGRDRQVDSGYYDIYRFFENSAVAPAEIRLTYLPQPFRIADERIAAYAHEIAASMREQGRLHEGPSVVRLERLDLASSPPAAVVQEAYYPEQAGSSFALDYPHPLFADWGGTLRDYYLREYGENRFVHNPLSVCLGICGQLVIEDDGRQYMLLVQRSAKLASMENSIGPSVAGSIDYATGLATLADLMNRSFAQETEEEVGLKPSEYELIPLAIAREIFRGDRPQLFGLMIAKITRTQMDSRLAACRHHGEFDHYEFVPLERGRLDSAQTARLNFEARMSYYLAEEYLNRQ